MAHAEGVGAALMELSDYDRAIEKIGGAFRLSVLLQKRVRELVRGARPLIESTERDSPIDIALREVLTDKVAFASGDKGHEDLVAALEKAMSKREKAEEKKKAKKTEA